MQLCCFTPKLPRCNSCVFAAAELSALNRTRNVRTYDGYGRRSFNSPPAAAVVYRPLLRPFFPPVFRVLYNIRGRLELFQKEDTVVVGLNCGFGVATYRMLNTPVAKQDLASNQGDIYDPMIRER